jgi:hypothetical protein
MNNPYTSMYMPSGFDQNQQGLSPVFQNIAQQQANQNAALAQQNQLVQQAGMTQKQGDASQIAMAKALREKDPNAVTPQAGTFGSRLDMALNSQATPNLQNQVNQMGSNTFNPFSDYNMGRNGFGSYGE